MFFPPILRALEKALSDNFVDGFHAEKVVSYNLKNQKKWGSKDRKIFAESFYEMIRWWKKLLWVLGYDIERITLDESSSQLFRDVIWLWVGLKSPESLQSPYFFGIKKDFNKLRKRWESCEGEDAISFSAPQWMHNLLKENLTQEQKLEFLNEPAPVYLRVNTLKTSREKLIQSLKNEDGIEAIKVNGSKYAVKLSERKNVFRTSAFKNGWFEVQDKGSQEISPFLQVESGMRVLDACAGAGGKALHLSNLMENKGKIISSDIHEWKLKELRRRSSRNGIDIIETKVLNSKQIKRLRASFHRVLLDVPCSGLGVLKRKPDTKWKCTPDRIQELLITQKELLNLYSQTVMPGGKFVYATCSVLKSENEDQVREFLETHDEWSLEEEKRTSLVDSDGFYMARLTKSKSE